MSEFKHFNCFLFCCEKNVGLWDLQIIRLCFYSHFTQCPNCIICQGDDGEDFDLL